MSISEAAFQKQIIDLAGLCGWRVVHFRPARVTIRGKETWRTPYTGHTGYPDLTLARLGTVLHVELKSETGMLSQDQEAWIDAMGSSGFVWRPSDWDKIVERLR